MGGFPDVPQKISVEDVNVESVDHIGGRTVSRCSRPKAIISQVSAKK